MIDCGEIFHGRCEDLVADMDDNSVDAIITDPWYGLGKAHDAEDQPPDKALLREFLRISSGPVMMFGGAPTRSMRLFLRLKPDRCLIWAPSFSLGKVGSSGMFWRWHPIWCWRLPEAQDTQLLTCDVVRLPTFAYTHKYKHTAMKPLPLMELLVGAFTHAGDIVFDPYIGSGTTLVACERLGRRWMGSEVVAEYIEIAHARIRENI